MIDENDIRKKIIAVSELGIDTSGYMVDAQEMSDAMYSIYCGSCQSEERFNYQNATDFEVGKQVGVITASGKIGVFAWYALTTYYGPDIYKLKEERKNQNAIHRKTMQSGSYELGVLLNHAINNSFEMRAFLREPIVLNTKDIINSDVYSYSSALQNHLENFMELPHVNVARKEKGTIRFNWSLLKDKDVIIPYIVGTQQSINHFARIASEICGINKAACAVGLFITRIKPSLDGKESKVFDIEDKIPIISESPFISPI